MNEIYHYIACFTAGILLSGYMWQRFAMQMIDRERDEMRKALDAIATESDAELQRLIREANKRHHEQQDW